MTPQMNDNPPSQSMSYANPPRAAQPGAADAWQRSLIEDLARDALVERRRARRWQIFFRSVGAVLVLLFIAVVMGWLGGGDSSGRRSRTSRPRQS